MSSPVCFEASCWRHLRLKPWPYAKIIRCSYGNMQRWTFSSHTLQRQESGLGRLVAHWCLTQLCPDGSRSANRPVIRSAQRNGSLKSNVTLYSTFALDKKKKKREIPPGGGGIELIEVWTTSFGFKFWVFRPPFAGWVSCRWFVKQTFRIQRLHWFVSI